MVDADNTQRWSLGTGGQSDGHSGLVEGGSDVVDGDGVVRVGTVKALAYPKMNC